MSSVISQQFNILSYIIYLFIWKKYNITMSLVEKLMKELESKPEEAKKLMEKMAELYPEFSFSSQVRKLVEQMSLMAEEQTKIWQEIKAIKEEQTKIWQEIKARR